MNLLSANLKAFLAIVRRGTVHGAAAELHLTQTGVTQRLRALETELGTTLFLRSRKGMALTQEGEALLRYCRGAEELEGEALSQIRGAAKDRPIAVTITGPTSVMTARIAAQVAPLYSAWPNLFLHLMLNDGPDRLSLVRSGMATLAIIPPEQVPNEMTSKRLKPDRYLLVATKKWRNRKLADILATERIIDFYESDSTTTTYLKKFKLIAHIKQPRLFVNNNEVLISYFKQGIGFGTLTEETAAPHLRSGDLVALHSGAVLEDPLALVWYPRPALPAYFKALLTELR